MYPIPENTDFSPFINQSIEQICLSPIQLILRFSGDITMNIEGEINHIRQLSSEKIIGNLAEKGVTLISLFGQPIQFAKRQSATVIILGFKNSEKLHIIDDTPEKYESISILGPGIDLIV